MPCAVGPPSAGFFSIVDIGAYRQSGWTFAVEWGVWPVSLSMALSVLSIVVLHRGLTDSERRWRSVAVFSLLAGATSAHAQYLADFVASVLPGLIRPAGVVISDQSLDGPGLSPAALPTGVAPGRYHLYRKPAAP